MPNVLHYYLIYPTYCSIFIIIYLYVDVSFYIMREWWSQIHSVYTERGGVGGALYQCISPSMQLINYIDERANKLNIISPQLQYCSTVQDPPSDNV